jgi:L-ascorbate metabolism protein UlaG (beta-lactamase superfamily)
MIQPVRKDDAFLADVAQTRNDLASLHLWWLGQSGFLLQWQGKHLLFDPYLSDSLTRKYACSDKPHVRMTERVVDPAQLNFIDVVTSSHNHTDHLDAETLIPLLRHNPKLELVIPEANRLFVADRLKIVPDIPVGLDAGESVELAGFKITAVPAAHETVETDEEGRCRFLGYVAECGPWTVYHSGDTMRFAGMVELLRQWQIDVAILPINGRSPERRVAGNLSGPEAASLAREIGAQVVIPCHYDMFEFNTVTPEAFTHAAHELQLTYKVLCNGERWTGTRSS